jgi:hypothetical protein
VCPKCGHKADPRKRKLRIRSLALSRVYAGPDTPADAKAAELDRLRMIADKQGYGLYWVVKQYRGLFDAEPALGCTPDDQFEEYAKMAYDCKQRGYKIGWAKWRYKQTFGRWPPRDWTDELCQALGMAGSIASPVRWGRSSFSS